MMLFQSAKYTFLGASNIVLTTDMGGGCDWDAGSKAWVGGTFHDDSR